MVEKILGVKPGTPGCLPSTVASLALAAGRPDWISVEDIDVPLCQRVLLATIDESNFDHLLATSTTTRQRTFALSSALQHAGDWLNVLPSPAVGLHLHSKEFRLCLRYWLWLLLFAVSSACPQCMRPTDAFEDHQMGCGGNGDRVARHDALRNVIFTAAQSAALGPRKEAPALIVGTPSRPTDVFLPTWSRGRPVALDVTVTSPLQALTIQEASTAGHALEVATSRKLATHLSPCRAAGLDFIPLAVETLGSWFIHAIGRQQDQRLGTSSGSRRLFQRLTITLWRGNANLWLNREIALPSHVDGVI